MVDSVGSQRRCGLVAGFPAAVQSGERASTMCALIEVSRPAFTVTTISGCSSVDATVRFLASGAALSKDTRK